jgi:RNA polymerase sigma-70 factor (ECF subfamily)
MADHGTTPRAAPHTAGADGALADPRLTRDASGLSFRDRIVAEIPNLRAFAASLAGSIHMADDLVQDTLLKAWSHADSFVEGTNLRAWLFTILRNGYFSILRKRGREVQDSTGAFTERLAVSPSQQGVVDLADFRIALAKLPPEQREVLIMVGVGGISYEDAASICGVAVGTVKSRVNRARTRLAALLGITDFGEIGPDGHALGAVQWSGPGLGHA